MPQVVMKTVVGRSVVPEKEPGAPKEQNQETGLALETSAP